MVKQKLKLQRDESVQTNISVKVIQATERSI